MILVVEDEPAIADAISYALSREGFKCKVASTCGEAKTLFKSAPFASAILDIGLPDGAGTELFKELRALAPRLPAIFLTARSEEIDRVLGLEMGADDYVTKPFSPRELAARVKAILRRCAQPHAPRAKGEASSAFVINPAACSISYSGIPLKLTRCEFAILKALLSSPGKVFSRRELMDSAWEGAPASEERTIDAHIKSLRAKLKSVSPQTEPIETRRGFGYSLAGVRIT